jgi:hypothetical protein
MKLLYLVPEGTLMPENIGWRAISLGNGHGLVCIDWRDELAEMNWVKASGVIPLPHPYIESSVPLVDEHIAHLSSRFAVKTGDNIHDLIREAMKVEPLFRIWAV